MPRPQSVWNLRRGCSTSARPIDSEQQALWAMKLEGVAHALQARGWSSARASALCGRFMDHLVDRRTLTYSILFTVTGTRPPD